MPVAATKEQIQQAKAQANGGKMTSRDFCYWLQGYFELADNDPGLSVNQVEMIQNHLKMVFVHEIDPSFPAEQQADLNAAHSGKPFGPNLTETGALIMRC